MKLGLTFSSIVLLVSSTEAVFNPPGPGDLRAPCPGLNALANQGELPRNGHGLNSEMVSNALLTYYGQQFEMGQIKVRLTPGLDPDNFNLDEVMRGKVPYSMYIDDITGVIDNNKVDRLLDPVRNDGRRSVDTRDVQAHAVRELVTRRRCRGRFSRSDFQESLITNLRTFVNTFLFAGDGEELEIQTDARTGEQYVEVPISTLEPFLRDNAFPDGWSPRDTSISANVVGDFLGPFLQPFIDADAEIARLAPDLQEEPFWQAQVAQLSDMLNAAITNQNIRCDPEGYGDPHFKTWSGKWYDFHGGCDLVLLTAPNFANGLGLTVHIRTKTRRDYSFIESAAIKLGDDILEIGSWGDYFINGVSNAELPVTLDSVVGATAVHDGQSSSEFSHYYNIALPDGLQIKMGSFKDMASVKIENVGSVNSTHFVGSRGLMGDYDANGAMLGRDGKTMVTDANAFGQEWQVLENEPMLFQTVREPQHPQACIMPKRATQEEGRRRLGESIARQAAEDACAGWGEKKLNCVFDVMATGDLDFAKAGPF